MRCPKCHSEQLDSNQECSQCGIIFSKFLAAQAHRQQVDTRSDRTTLNETHEQPTRLQLKALVFPPPCDVPFPVLGGRALVFIALLIWGGRFIFSSIESNYAGTSFMHLINLPFHEAGHMFFRPFGAFITSLGGSMGQMLMPLLCLGTLLLKTRDAFGASACLWWFGQNFFDLAPYIDDARSGTLPLVGGNFGHSSPYGFHDWEYLLTESGLLQYDHFIAQSAVIIGTIIMCTAYLWGGCILFMQYNACKDT
jgi:hypothetical protein